MVVLRYTYHYHSGKHYNQTMCFTFTVYETYTNITYWFSFLP